MQFVRKQHAHSTHTLAKPGIKFRSSKGFSDPQTHKRNKQHTHTHLRRESCLDRRCVALELLKAGGHVIRVDTHLSAVLASAALALVFT